MKIAGGILILWLVAGSGAGAQTLQQQATCAEQAERVYQADKANAEAGTNLLGYEDHYDPQMDRCFMLEHAMMNSGGLAFTTTLTDAFEGHILAMYMVNNGRQVDCELTPGHETTFCKSGAEFNAFVERYMGKVFGGVEPWAR